MLGRLLQFLFNGDDHCRDGRSRPVTQEGLGDAMRMHLGVRLKLETIEHKTERLSGNKAFIREDLRAYAGQG